MAGLGLALVGGALKGFGEGQLASIKAMREEKLKQLDYEHAEKLQGSQQEFLSKEGAANRASQERQTNAQLDTNLKLGELSAKTSRYGVDVSSETQKLLSKNEIAARRDEIGAQIASGEKIAGMQIDTQKDIAQAQIDAQKDLNVKFVPQANGTSVMMRGNEAVKMPIDPATGKPMTPAITDTDTNEAKNVKYLLTLGVPQDKAMALVYNAKNANRDLAQAGIFKSIVDGMSTMKNLGESDFDFAQKKAKTITESIYGPEEGAAAPAPGSPSSAADPGTTDPNAVPADPTKRVVGKVYKNTQGDSARWTAHGWEPVGG
jgi:hypothetical protein